MTIDLDQRQRAMLEEMRVRVWWPPSDAPPIARELAAPHARAAPAAGSDQIGAMAQAQSSGNLPMDKTGVGPLSEVDTMNWQALARAINSCNACRLCVGRRAAVFQLETVPRQADWMVVGEPPNEEDERAGAPFAGPAGELLDNMLRAVQITRTGAGSAGARLTNVVKCRPSAVRNPQSEELATCSLYLRREIALTRPKVILAMGRFAAQALLGSSHPELNQLPFGKLRGQIFRFADVPVVVTYHPSTLLRAQADKAGAWADLCLARSVSRQVA